jgi:hypothetical protein
MVNFISEGFIESFRGEVLRKLKRAYKIRANKTRFMEETFGGFAKKPFGNTKSVVEYLGRYTHKIAISNHRIRSIDTQNVTLIIRIIGGGALKQMTLTHEEFIRRFSLHILPKRFVKFIIFLSST